MTFTLREADLTLMFQELFIHCKKVEKSVDKRRYMRPSPDTRSKYFSLTKEGEERT